MRCVRFEWWGVAMLAVYGCDPATAAEQSKAADVAEVVPSESEQAGSDAKATECAEATTPENMVCVPAGPAVIGSDDHEAGERPRHEVQISTFFMDKFEVTNAQYRACEKAGHCPKRKGMPRSYRTFLEDDLPAIPISWYMAHKYCVWAGKRLPTEAEWEKAARGGDEGRLYPWGDEAPTCDKANYKACVPRTTKPVGSYPEGPYGIFEMAGNGYEWVKDWGSDCYGGCEKACGDACLGVDPQGPCGGAPRCEGATGRVLKGGSWYWPAEQMRGPWRRVQKPGSGMHRLSFRCASSTAELTQAPPRQLAEPPPALGVPEPPTERQLAIANDVRDDDDVLKIGTCDRQGKATHDCRDPMTYYRSNEANRGVWGPYVANLGGGYVGLGADQAYDLIAAAKSRWAWLFDYDPEVVRIHYILRAIVPAAESPDALTEYFRVRNLPETETLIRASLADQPDEIDPTLKVLHAYRGKLLFHYLESLEGRKRYPGFGWLAHRENYDYVRALFAQGRIIIRKGNLLTDVALPDIARSASQLNVPIRVIYTSNADDQWKLTEQYRANMMAFPVDPASVVLRTLIPRTIWQDEETASKWHYVVHSAEHMQEKLSWGWDRVEYFMEDRLPGRLPFVSTVRLPGAASPAALSQR